MKCRSCGYVSFDRAENCKRCGAPRTAPGAPAPATPAQPAAGSVEHEFPDEPFNLDFSPAALAPAAPDRDQGRGGGAPQLEDLIAQTVELDENDPAWPHGALDLEPFPDAHAAPVFYIADDLDLPGPSPRDPQGVLAPRSFVISEPQRLDDPAAGPIIDADDQIPDRYWATEVAGLGRRAAALGVDNVILSAITGLFFASALLALAGSGYDTSFLLSPAGLWAVALPFALLAALLGLAYHVIFHGWRAATPGQSLLGLEVRTADGQAPSWTRALLRGCAAALGLACAGVGVAWALFEPGRRGWADLLSGTVVSVRRQEGPPALTTPGGAGTMRAL